ncbi:hypothetical protein PA25_36220 [Pseudoalteromonas sp. A25]|uniref:hypothetical protein n=1 Tax=Pseudoalteromonas sp. A25 TaxID=116092 RepID=UPI001260CD7E|nr:hypothetical protein [Pseudoalteromonas sp. A25]BBN83637.1 hypothetical protein PA25_36220 [Pseudoalteromonas sp. A25]
MKAHFVLFVISLTCSGLSFASTFEPHSTLTALKERVELAIDKFERTQPQDWSYRVERFEDEEGNITNRIELFDPSLERPKQWQLLSINEQKPSQQQSIEFVKHKQELASKEQQQFSVKLRSLIQLDTLKFTAQDRQYVYANFDVKIEELGEDASKVLKGSLIYDKNNGYIKTIEVVNTASFSPVFTASIHELKLVFSFLNINDSVLLKQQALAMKGRFAFFTEINEVSTDTFYDYRYVGQ